MRALQKQVAWDRVKGAVTSAAEWLSDAAGEASDGVHGAAHASADAVRGGAAAVGRGVAAVDHKVESVANGVIAGAIAGAIASWAMNQFQAASAKPVADRKGETATGGPPRSGDDATVKVAETITKEVTGHGLKAEAKPAAGAAVHYGYGAAMGAIYGGLTELAPSVGTGLGIPYATALWLFGDEIAVPALGLSKPPAATTPAEHAAALSSHFVYGVTLDIARRILRHIV